MGCSCLRLQSRAVEKATKVGKNARHSFTTVSYDVCPLHLCESLSNR